MTVSDTLGLSDNVVQEIRFASMDNGKLILDELVRTGPFTYTPPLGTTQVRFFVLRVTPRTRDDGPVHRGRSVRAVAAVRGWWYWRPVLSARPTPPRRAWMLRPSGRRDHEGQ